MTSPLLDYLKPLSPRWQQVPRPASAQGVLSERNSLPRRPTSVPPGSKPSQSKVRSMREVQKSRAVYSLDDNDEPDPPPAGRDPTLEEKSEADADEHQKPRWVTTRTRGGVVRERLSRSYAVHVAGRLAGRDKDSGFRSPFGTDYVSVGGEVSAMSGEAIRNKIGGGWQSTMRAKVGTQLPPKVKLQLEHTVDFKVNNYKFNYFQIDLSDRPLEHAPKRSLAITFTVLSGSGEAYAAMEAEHEYPTGEKGEHTWNFKLVPKAVCSEGEPEKQSRSIVITPSDPSYATSKKKRVVLAVWSELGFLECRLKAVTQTFLTGTSIAAMLENRGTKKLEERERAQELKDYKEGIKHSYMRCKRAQAGKDLPPSRERPQSALEKQSSLSQAQSPLSIAPEADTTTKKKSFASALGGTLSLIETNPEEYYKMTGVPSSEEPATVVNIAGGTTNRGATTSRTARSTGSKTGRSFKFTSRSFASSMMSSRSSMQGERRLRGVPVQTDEDLIALDKGNWTKVVLKARVPAAMRLEWALQELEVEKGMRTGETATRRYIKTMPREVRKRDQEQNMRAVLVNSTAGLGSGPIMTPDTLQALYGDEYRAGEFFIESQKSGQDIPHDQTRVPSLKLEVLHDDIAPQGAAKDEGRLASARQHIPHQESAKSAAPSGHLSSRGKPGEGGGGTPGSARGKTKGEGGAPGSARGKTGGEGAPGSAREKAGVLGSERGKGQPLSARMDGGKGGENFRGLQESFSGSLSARTSNSEGDVLQGALFSDEEKLAYALFESAKEQHATKYSKTQQFLDHLDEGLPAAEVGVNLPRMVKILLEMKIISTSKSSAIGKRDVNGIGREIFHERALDHHPADEEIVLDFNEFKITFDRISGLLGKPYYADRTRPKGIDKDLWKRLKEDINPTNRLKRISKQENFRRSILKAFGKYNKKSDGKLLKDEYIELCLGELGLSKPQANALLEPAGINPFFKTIDLFKFAHIFIAPEEPTVDVRESDESRGKCLDTYHLLHNVKTSTSTISVEELESTTKHIDTFQMNARVSSEPESKDIVKTGWLYRQETAGAAKLWRMYFALVESHVGGAVIRLFTSPVSRLYHSKSALEAAGQVDEMWVDGSEPAKVVTLADANAAREQAMVVAEARGLSIKFPQGEDAEGDDWGQCIIQVDCRNMNDLSERKKAFLKVRGSLVEDEAEDWIQAIRLGSQKRHLWSGDTLMDIRPLAKASDELRTVCEPALSEQDVGFLVKDVTTILLEALRPSCIIEPTFDKDGVVSLARNKQEEDDAADKGKKKKVNAMETIKEETMSALRAFMTTRRSEVDQAES